MIHLFVAFVRGDYEVNETKLRNIVGEPIHVALITADDPLVAGYIGPYNISKDVTVYIDSSLKGVEGMVAGANKEDAIIKDLISKEILERLSMLILPR